MEEIVPAGDDFDIYCFERKEDDPFTARVNTVEEKRSPPVSQRKQTLNEQARNILDNYKQERRVG